MTWMVRGAVDTQNSFGAMIRVPYQATLRFHGSLARPANPDSWILEALQIGTQKYGYHNPYKAEIIDGTTAIDRPGLQDWWR